VHVSLTKHNQKAVKSAYVLAGTKHKVST